MRWRPEHAGEDCREMEIFTTFRGREPTIAALLRHAGLVV
jgi:Zn-dependent oligopeptidase